MNNSFETTLSRNRTLIDAYCRMKSGKTITPRHEMLNESTLTDAQKAKREEIVTALKRDPESLKKKYGNDWESVAFAIATKHAIAESLLAEENDSFVGHNSILMPKTVTHKFMIVDNIHSHSFEPTEGNIKAVTEHLNKFGFKQVGLPDSTDRSTETTFSHPTGMKAFVGNNKHTAWMDITH